jgi:hypothetical protein
MKPLDKSKWHPIVRYGWNILISLDQTLNVIIAGDPDETVSSRFGKWLAMPHDTLRWKVSYALCRTLHAFDPDHCERAIELDEGRDDVINDTSRFIRRYIWNCLICFNQNINVLLAGDPDETVNSRIGKWKYHAESGTKRFIGNSFCTLMSFFDEQHCERYREDDEGKDDILRKGLQVEED